MQRSAKAGASQPCGPVRRADHRSAPALRPRLLDGLRSSVQTGPLLICLFNTYAEIQELCTVTNGQVGGREHVVYRLRVQRSGSEYLVEQQAYYDTDGTQITWMRVLCSGYQAVQPGR